MSNEAFDRYYVLEQFREFYAAVLRYKQEIEAAAGQGDGKNQPKGGPPPLPSLGAAGGEDAGAGVQAEGDLEELEPIEEGEDGETQAGVIRAELSALIQRQQQAILRRGDEREQKRFREVQYVIDRKSTRLNSSHV